MGSKESGLTFLLDPAKVLLPPRADSSSGASGGRGGGCCWERFLRAGLAAFSGVRVPAAGPGGDVVETDGTGSMELRVYGFAKKLRVGRVSHFRHAIVVGRVPHYASVVVVGRLPNYASVAVVRPLPQNRHAVRGRPLRRDRSKLQIRGSNAFEL